MEAFVPPPIRVTRTSSVESELNRNDGSSESIEHEETSTLEPQARESTNTEWTDEKHCLYLKSMEASFVDQLYSSSDSLGWRAQEGCSSDPKSSRKMHASTRITSGQFKVLRDGFWEMVNFRRDELQLNKADGSHVLSANPWIRHFRSGCSRQIVTTSVLQEKAAFAATTNRFPVSHSDLCRWDSDGSNTEGTDQNFVNEVVGREKPSRVCSTKRMKTSSVATSSNDQVVPHGKFPVTEDVAASCDSPNE